MSVRPRALFRMPVVIKISPNVVTIELFSDRFLGMLVDASRTTGLCSKGHYDDAPQDGSDGSGNRRHSLARAHFSSTHGPQRGPLPAPGDLLSPGKDWKADRNWTPGTHIFSRSDSHRSFRRKKSPHISRRLC